MHRKLVTALLLMTLCRIASSDDVQRQDQLVWDYAEFLESFSSKDWQGVARFVASSTKVGFGGESGMDGLMQVYGDSEECHKAMVEALALGCRKTGEGDGLRCISPPQLGPDVIYLGARASFAYNADEDVWMAEYLICGGD